ncbi:phosphate/phosphite/phosphonate ABC transporter substrate-binding protein [Sulfurivirga caldicuralii]|nr:phosphate/phosphite/phosphonate ABC transporter substrate-binding protein [Sulfurivirga caldicuralii]
MSLLFGLVGCSEQSSSSIGKTQWAYGDQSPLDGETKTYTFAIHPLYSPARLFEAFGPVIDYLNARLPNARLVLEATRNYPEYDQKIIAGRPDFIVPNPFQTLIGLRHGYHVYAKVANDEDFRGIILVRKDGRIRTPKDLKGKVIAAPGKTALAATMMPKYFLATHGVDVHKDVRYLYTGTQESTILSLTLGKAQAATTWPVPWRLIQVQRPELAKQIRLAWQTDTLPNNSVMAHERVPRALARQVADLLVAMKDDPQGRRLLEQSTFTAFEAANNATYDPVRMFIERYSKLVEPVEIP